MAQKRMFDKSIVKCDDFIEMPDSTQNLYFHLSMEADDDGFVDNWKSIMRMTGKKEDDLKILIAKQFIIPFESGVIVIKHWRINNYLRKDRYNPTKYIDEKAQLDIGANEVYTLKNNLGIPMVDTDKNSIDKNSIDNNIYTQENFYAFWNAYPKKRDKGRVEKWFTQHKPTKETVELMIKQIERLKDTKSWKENNGQYIPYPSTWLNAKGWEDEFETDSEREERIDKEIMEGIYGT